MDTVGAKFTINNHHEWKMGLISDRVCVCALTCCLVYLLWCYLQVEPNATIGEIKSMFHKSRECHLSADCEACDFTNNKSR